MAEQTFQSPGFFEREISLTEQRQGPVGTPAGVIGTAQRGPAFVPVTVGSFSDFITKFGDLDPKKFGPYAVNEFLKNRQALTYMRVLGAGANSSSGDITDTKITGRVKNAGFIVSGSAATAGTPLNGTVQFIVAQHDATANEAFGMPMLTDNDSIVDVDNANLVRAAIFCGSDARVIVTNGDITTAKLNSDLTTLDASDNFKLVISSSAGTSFGNDDGFSGVRIFTASLNPTSTSYIANFLNTNPELFESEKHYLQADFAVDDEVAEVKTGANLVGVVQGDTVNKSTDSGDSTLPFAELFGRFDTRYTTAKTPSFISQPFGTKEFDLFHIEGLDDGEYPNNKYKISIANVRKAIDADDFGTFSVQVRQFNDTDPNSKVVEEFVGLSMNPLDERYIARIIGDTKVAFNFDADSDTERRIIVSGKYPNRSNYIRVVMSTAHLNGDVPANAVPFGFRGATVLKTNDSLTDGTTGAPAARRLECSTAGSALTGSILPPLPFRFKVTRGDVATTAGYAGHPGVNEITSADFYWGVKFERNSDVLNANQSSDPNRLVASLTRFSGIEKLDTLVTGSGKDLFNNNKFTLANVALGNTAVADLTGSAADHMREAAYIRNHNPASDSVNYTIDDGVLSGRISMATLMARTSSIEFNRFSAYNKFTTPMYGGFDGVNILDKDSARLNDKGTSVDTGGAASTTYVSPGLASNVNGTGKNNNGVASYNAAINMMTDPWVVNTNILAIPGIREPLVTNSAAKKVRDYGKAIYLMDIPQYDENVNRLFDDKKIKPDVEKTEELFSSRGLDNNYTAAYFPDVQIDDEINTQRVTVPPSVAAIAALGFNDRVAFPWFAPAGFNRAALSFVKNVEVRLSAEDRDNLYTARINPIATFPREGFVIWGQKTLQVAKSALDRINVRRLLLEVKRIIGGIALNLVFEPNNAQTRAAFVKQATLQLGIIQTAAGVESFSVVMDSSNNKAVDINANRMNGRIVIVPTRAVEFIAVDFIITPAGVEFT
jgi:hypothetical protein